MYQNRATLIGFLGKDAEAKTTRNNISFTVLSLATKRSWKDRESGERRSDTTWHRCVVWGKARDFAATLTKGAHVQVEGGILTRQYALKTGEMKSVTEVRVLSIVKLDRPKTSESETHESDSPKGVAA
jgi:single-strand DNA-binding protein